MYNVYLKMSLYLIQGSFPIFKHSQRKLSTETKIALYMFYLLCGIYI